MDAKLKESINQLHKGMSGAIDYINSISEEHLKNMNPEMVKEMAKMMGSADVLKEAQKNANKATASLKGLEKIMKQWG